MRRSPVFLPLLALTVAATLATGACSKKEGGAAAGAGGPPGGEMPPLPVETATVELQPLVSGLQTVGSLRADESVVVRPEIAGRIQRIHFTEGGRVSAGQPLFTLDGSLAQADLNEASANLENSRRNAARAAELNADKLIARAEYDRTRAELAVNQARAASARATLSKMTLRAPFSGQIGLREVSVGEYVNAGQDLVTLVRLDPIEVDFSVPEGALSQLSRGQKISITVDGSPNDRFGGEVVAIDPSIDVNSRSVKLRAQIANPDGRLRPGQFAKLILQDDANAKGLLVPEQALMQAGEERFVYTVVDGVAKKAVIKTGARVPGKVQVVEGLKAGDVVITAGQAKPMMHEGAKVMALPPPGAKPAAQSSAKRAAAATSTAPSQGD